MKAGEVFQWRKVILSTDLELLVLHSAEASLVFCQRANFDRKCASRFPATVPRWTATGLECFRGSDAARHRGIRSATSCIAAFKVLRKL
jgi:hypothetical protein